MTTAQEVFNITIALMDEVNGAGISDSGDTVEYKNKTLAILNVLRGELYPYSDTFEVTEIGKRPICPEILDFVTPIELDDYICQSVMPYGLAAHLALSEDLTSAGYFQQRYDELKLRLASGLPSISEDVFDIYGDVGGLYPYNEFGYWS